MFTLGACQVSLQGAANFEECELHIIQSLFTGTIAHNYQPWISCCCCSPNPWQLVQQTQRKECMVFQINQFDSALSISYRYFFQVPSK